MNKRRVLAIDPTSCGFGYIVFEGNLPIDWGTARARDNSLQTILRRFESLVQQLEPSILLLEDYSEVASRRNDRLKRVLSAIEKQSTVLAIKSRLITRRRVEARFESFNLANKHQRAVFIAAQYPELTSRLPPKRKPWMSEDERMSIFDAAALAIVFFSCPNRRI